MTCLEYTSKLDQDVDLEDADQSIFVCVRYIYMYIYIYASRSNVTMSHDVFGVHGIDPCSEIRQTQDERICLVLVSRSTTCIETL